VEHHTAGRDADAGGDLEQRQPQADDLSGGQFGVGQMFASQMVQQHVGER
jgi:hypothetical protein